MASEYAGDLSEVEFAVTDTRIGSRATGDEPGKLYEARIYFKSFYGEEVRDAVLNAARISPDDTVLDVGAGTGFLTEAAAMIARKVIALDFSRG